MAALNSLCCTFTVTQGRSVCLLARSCNTILDIKHSLEDRTGIPLEAQILTPYGCQEDGSNLSELGIGPDSTLELSGRLRGGKGGFGSLLRGSRKASQTENDDAYRDLSGRRLRIVNAEKKLQEWAGAEEQRKKEKQEAKLERERAKAERRAESSQVDGEAVRKEQSAALLSLHKALESSVKAGVKRTVDVPPRPAAKKPRYQSESDDDENSDSGSDSDAGEPSSPGVAAGRVTGKLADLANSAAPVAVG